MRSQARIMGHPVHPMLVAFPVTFLVAAFATDAVGVWLGLAGWWTAGAYLALAGIGTAVLAAVPGFVDYVYTVPPRSSARRRATLHMLANLGAVALFAAAWVLRGSPEAEPPLAVLGLEGAGLVLLVAGGWMGGTLVYRNQIGVDPRYAGAGKWQETRLEARPGEPVQVPGADRLETNQMMLLRVNGRRLVLARTEEGYAVFDDRCTHKGGSLAGGAMICGTVQCPWHGSQFDVQTGKVKAGPADRSLGTYRVDAADGQVRLVL